MYAISPMLMFQIFAHKGLFLKLICYQFVPLVDFINGTKSSAIQISCVSNCV